MEERPLCPECSSSSPVYKVSQVYLAGITNRDQRREEDRATLTVIYGKDLTTPAEIQQVTRQFGPPSGSSRVVRPIHPDLTVGTFSVAALVFLYRTYPAAMSVFWMILVVWALALGVYLAMRKSLIARHQSGLAAVVVEKKQVEGAIENWMHLYYCAEDGCVFDPRRSGGVPLDQLRQLLLLPPGG